MHTALQPLSRFQRRARHSRAFGIAPDQLIGIEVRRITRQEMQRELAFQAGHVVLDHRILVRGQAIENQAHGLFAPVHHFLQQLDEHFTRQGALVNGKPERAFGADGRRGADALALPGALNDRRLSFHRPGFAVHRIGAKARLVPKQYVRATAAGFYGDSEEGITLPVLYGLRFTQFANQPFQG